MKFMNSIGTHFITERTTFQLLLGNVVLLFSFLVYVGRNTNQFTIFLIDYKLRVLLEE